MYSNHRISLIISLLLVAAYPATADQGYGGADQYEVHVVSEDHYGSSKDCDCGNMELFGIGSGAAALLSLGAFFLFNNNSTLFGARSLGGAASAQEMVSSLCRLASYAEDFRTHSTNRHLDRLDQLESVDSTGSGFLDAWSDTFTNLVFPSRSANARSYGADCDCSPSFFGAVAGLSALGGVAGYALYQSRAALTAALTAAAMSSSTTTTGGTTTGGTTTGGTTTGGTTTGGTTVGGTVTGGTTNPDGSITGATITGGTTTGGTTTGGTTTGGTTVGGVTTGGTTRITNSQGTTTIVGSTVTGGVTTGGTTSGGTTTGGTTTGGTTTGGTTVITNGVAVTTGGTTSGGVTTGGTTSGGTTTGGTTSGGTVSRRTTTTTTTSTTSSGRQLLPISWFQVMLESVGAGWRSRFDPTCQQLHLCQLVRSTMYRNVPDNSLLPWVSVPAGAAMAAVTGRPFSRLCWSIPPAMAAVDCRRLHPGCPQL